MRSSFSVAALCLLGLAAVPAFADIVYDNTNGFVDNYVTGTSERKFLDLADGRQHVVAGGLVCRGQ
jgi:ferric-dicitrate binding protein FerR (iron transport regulator)